MSDHHEPGETTAAGRDRPSAEDIALRLLAFSRLRLKVFEPYGMTVNDIAWQLLLTCFVAQQHDRALSIYKVCDEVPVPKSVSVRWLRALRACGMIEYDESKLGLSAPVRLTPPAVHSLRDLMDA